MLLGAAPNGDLAVGDGPPAGGPPPSNNQAFDVIVAVSPASGAYATSQPSQSFNVSRAPRPSAAELFANGAIFVFQTAINIASAPAGFATMLFTAPDGSAVYSTSPNVYVGSRWLPTVIGLLQPRTYLVCVFGKNVLIPGRWKVAVTFEPYPGGPILTDAGAFNVPQMAVEFV